MKQMAQKEQMAEAACDILFENYVVKEIMDSYNQQTERIKESEAYKQTTNDKQRQILLSSRTAPACNRKLLDKDWVNNMKESFRNNCNLDALPTMAREDLGKLFSARNAFIDRFAPVNNRSDDLVREENVPVKTNESIQMK